LKIIDDLANSPPGEKSRPGLPYMPGVDGLRAIAVMAVFFYHAGFLWAAGGFLGVESFFVVSGYLITALLMNEYLAREKIDLTNFWLRRARRLLPALWLLLGSVLLIAWLRAPDAWLRLKEDIWGALFYGTNWLYILREIPYFEQFGRPPLLQHLWSLGVEEQFYLFWPLILWLLLWIMRIRGGSVKRVLVPIGVLIAISFSLMILMYTPGVDPSRVYYGTDTRAAGFLIGAALAVVLPPGKQVRINQIFAFFAFAILILLYWRLDEFSDLLYRGGFLLTAFLTAVVMLSAAQPGTLLSRILGVGLLRWIGTRSYAIYLWHWPIMQVNRFGFECNASPWACTGVNLALTLIFAELSYRLVEAPIRRAGFTNWAKTIQRRVPQPVWGAGIMIVLGLVVFSVTGLQTHASNLQSSPEPVLMGWDPNDFSRPPSRSTPTPPAAPAVGFVDLSSSSSRFDDPIATKGSPSTDVLESDTLDDPITAGTDSPVTMLDSPTYTPEPSSIQVTFIGDSVMEGTVKLWEQVLDPDDYILDANRNRTIKDVPDILRKLDSQNQLANVVVLHIGTNRPFDADEFDELMELMLDLGVERAIFINVKRPVTWEYTINKRIAEGVERWRQAEIVDWYTIAKPYPGYFGDDQTHVTRTGARAYVKAILATLSMPELGGISLDR